MESKNVLVTGANGQLGMCIRDVVKICNSKTNWFFTDIDELDITDFNAVRKFVETNKINIIVNCAAYTNVDRAEDDSDNALIINSDAVGNLAIATKITSGTLIHISTDYVFDGTKHIPYLETDATKPIGVYGRTKRYGEKRIERCDCKAIVIRTAWLYSEHGKNFVKTMMNLFKEKDSIKVVGDQIGTPTYAGDLAKFIVAIIELEEYTKTGLYNFTNEGTASWYDFAVAVKNLLVPDSNCEIIACTTEDFPTRAERPKYSVLSKQKIKDKFGIKIRHWQDSLAVCANKIKQREKTYEV